MHRTWWTSSRRSVIQNWSELLFSFSWLTRRRYDSAGLLKVNRRESSLLERPVKIDRSSQTRCGLMERLVEWGVREVVMEIGNRDVHKISNGRKGFRMGRQQEPMHVGQLLFQSRKGTRNGVQLDLKHLVGFPIDHVIRPDQATRNRLIGGTAKHSLRDIHKMRRKLVGHTANHIIITITHSFSCSNSHSGFLQICSSNSWNRAFRTKPLS